MPPPVWNFCEVGCCCCICGSYQSSRCSHLKLGECRHNQAWGFCYKNEAKKMLVVFLLDTSGSMNQQCANGLSLLDCAKSAVEHFHKVKIIPSSVTKLHKIAHFLYLDCKVKGFRFCISQMTQNVICWNYALKFLFKHYHIWMGKVKAKVLCFKTQNSITGNEFCSVE